MASHGRHDGDHACSECEKKFGTKQSLKRHQKKIHKRSSDQNDISENSNETQNDVNLNGNNDTVGPDLMDLINFDVTTADLDPLIGIDLNQAVILPINF